MSYVRGGLIKNLVRHVGLKEDLISEHDLLDSESSPDQEEFSLEQWDKWSGLVTVEDDYDLLVDLAKHNTRIRLSLYTVLIQFLGRYCCCPSLHFISD